MKTNILNLNADDKSFVSKYTSNDNIYDFGMGNSHCVLEYSRDNHTFQRLIISGTSSGAISMEKWKNYSVSKFSKQKAQRHPPIKPCKLAKLDRKCNFAVFPTEIIDLIAKIYFETPSIAL